MIITQEELNIPNFIALYLEKANTSISKSQLFQNILTDKRQIVKFSHNRVYLQETDQKQVELEYKNILYLNNSITNENFFCLAYTIQSDENNKSAYSKNKVNALVLYSNDVDLIDDVIREYAYYVSSELNQSDSKVRYTHNEEDYAKVEQHTCYMCPMQQFIELCEHLNGFANQHEVINDILVEKLNNNLDSDDQNYLLDCLNYHSLTMDTYSNLRDKNQLIVALIHKICKKKQVQHLLEYLKRKLESNSFHKSSEFCLMKSNSSNCCAHSKSCHTNFVAEKSHQNTSLKRSKSIDSCHFTAKRTQSTNFERISKKEKTVRQSSKLVFEKFFDKLSADSNLSANGLFLGNKDCVKRCIFNKIVGFPSTVCIVATSMMPFMTTQTRLDENDQAAVVSPENERKAFVFKRFGCRNDVLKFWRKIISEQIILIKMEKENRKLTIKAMYASKNEQQSKTQLKDKHSNFKYTEITPCLKEVNLIWKSLLTNQHMSLAVMSLNDEDTAPSVTNEKCFNLDKIRKIVYKGTFLWCPNRIV